MTANCTPVSPLDEEIATRLVTAEGDYQRARLEMAAAEDLRYRQVYAALVAARHDAAALRAAVPGLGLATIRAAARRYAPPIGWAQDALFADA